MAKIVYPNAYRHIPGSRRWVYSIDGVFVLQRCRSGERPAVYGRRTQVDAEPLATDDGPNRIVDVRRK